MYKILIDFGSLQFDPLWIALIIMSLLLLAVGQSYVSARKLAVGPAIAVMLAILLIGDLIVYYIFNSYFRVQYPADYTFPHVSIYSFGFMLMLAFVIGTIWLIIQGGKRSPKIEADTILDMLVFIIIGSIIGARVVYILTQWGQYSGNIKAMLQITEGGLSIHGGIFGAMLVAGIYVWAKGLDYWELADFMFMALPLGMFFGRIGCFLNGCCFGIRCELSFPLGVKFPNAQHWLDKGMAPDLANLYDAGHAAMGEFSRHPAQLYEAVGALAIFFYLINFRKNAVFKGHIFLMFVWLYSILRFIVEFYRFGDPTTGQGSSIVLANFITVAQVASLILAIIALILMQDLKRRAALSKILATGEAPESRKATAETFEEEEPEIETDEEADDVEDEKNIGGETKEHEI